MRSLISIAALLLLLVHTDANPLVARDACNADNCARAVSGTALAQQSSRLADCSSFFKTTVIPATSTRTVTTPPPPILRTSTFTTNPVYDVSTVFVTGTTTTITRVDPTFYSNQKRAELARTTITPTAVPAYASACSGTARYSSACSCAGVKRSTTTERTPVATRTVTAGRTTTSLVYVAATTTIKTTATVVQPAVFTGIICGSLVRPQGDCGCAYNITCGEQATSGDIFLQTTVTSEFACAKLCDSYSACIYANYDVIRGTCQLRESMIYNPETETQPDDDIIAFIQGDTCTTPDTCTQ